MVADDTHIRELPTDLPGADASAALDLLDRATARLTAAVNVHTAELPEPSSLPGWSRVNVLAHLRYVAEAMHRMTDGHLAGRADAMYPDGRDKQRPGTLAPHPAETVEELLDSHEAAAGRLSAFWHGLSVTDWDRRVVDPEVGETALSRFLILRLTEIEVHSVDLGLPGLEKWSDSFVQIVLPLRLAWLGLARRKPAADLDLNGSWVLTDRETCWLVEADGTDVVVGEVTGPRSADCHITGTWTDLLALLLGRPANVEMVGPPDLTHGFKAAFPGP